MARELGLNPGKLGKLANHDQEPWKAPLPEFLERLYAKRFGRSAPLRVAPIEVRAREVAAKKAERRERRRRARMLERGEAEFDPGGREDVRRVSDPPDVEGRRNLRRSLLEVVETQAGEGDPPEAGRAVERLVSEGYSRADAVVLVARVLAAEMFAILKEDREHDGAKYAKALDALPRLLYEDTPAEEPEQE